jgi:ABC-type transporter Mla subunit MlaD
MKTVQQVFACALLAALTALTIAAVRVVNSVPAEIRETREALFGEVAAARRDLNAQLRDLAERSERQITGLRQNTLAEVDEIRETADRRLGDTLSRADAALATLDATRQDLKPVLAQSAAVATHVNDALPLFLDCDHNPDCVFNRYVGASKGIERAALNFGQASADVRGAVPRMLSTWDQIGVGVAGTAANLDRLTKPHWYDRLIGYGLNGVVIYRNLNPATNLTTRGAQIVSGRP